MAAAVPGLEHSSPPVLTLSPKDHCTLNLWDKQQDTFQVPTAMWSRAWSSTCQQRACSRAGGSAWPSLPSLCHAATYTITIKCTHHSHPETRNPSAVTASKMHTHQASNSTACCLKLKFLSSTDECWDTFNLLMLAYFLANVKSYLNQSLLLSNTRSFTLRALLRNEFCSQVDLIFSNETKI